MLNEVFVCIKVDREERPDLDNIYMRVCQMLTGSGGWPLTIIMTPDKEPFFAGTYIPRETRFGRIGMLDLIPRINGIWAQEKHEVLSSAGKITAALKETEQRTPGGELIRNAAGTLLMSFRSALMRTAADFPGARNSRRPKSHLPAALWYRTGNERALQMVEKTLQEMRCGGIYDHIGFGFHRYSTDPDWLVPHFEKMLYDQALIAMAYVEAFQATQKRNMRKPCMK